MKKFGPKRILETKFLYCNKHGETDFVLSGKKILKWKCCKCTVDYSQSYRIKNKIKSIEYKGGKCSSCGYDKCIAALTFHHIDPLFKDFDLAGTGMSKSWDKLVSELDKCILLCLNCHIELHHEQDKENKRLKQITPTTHHKKLIHKINSKKLGIKPSP